jgi:hypothetical protein
MKIREIISEAPVGQKVMNKFAAPNNLAYKAGQQVGKIGSAIGNFFTAQPQKGQTSIAGVIGGALDDLNKGAKPVDFSKKGLDTDALNDFASLLVSADKDNKEIVPAMKRALERNPNSPVDPNDKEIILSAIRQLSKTPGLKFDKGDFNTDYQGILKQLQITPNDIPDSVTNPSAPGTAAAKPPGTAVDPNQQKLPGI